MQALRPPLHIPRTFIPASSPRSRRLATVVGAQRRLSTRNTRHLLNTGATIPALGFGTFQDAALQEEAVVKALQAGYRHIDTARIYDTELQTGSALAKSGVPRDSIFLATKLWMNNHHPDDVEKSLDESLQKLGTDYVDCLMMHYPVTFERGENLFPVGPDGFLALGNTTFVDTWRAMEAVMKSGKARAIGVSNFSQKEIEQIISKCAVIPAVHQMEIHPYLQQRDFTNWHRERGIHNTHFSPLGNSNDFYRVQAWARKEASSLPPPIQHPVLAEIAKKHNKSPPQIAYSWGINSGRSVLAKSVIDWQIAENIEADFELDADDMAKIATMDVKARFNDPSPLYGYQFYEGLDGFLKRGPQIPASEAVGKI